MISSPRHIVALLLLTAACHSDPFGPAFYGPTGPLTVGPEARLTYGAGNKYGIPFAASAPSWADGAGGILFTFSPRPFQVGEKLGVRCIVVCTSVSRDSLDTCLALLPPSGGGAYWNLCETRLPHTDSIDIFTAGALNRTGQLLYIQMTGPTTLPVPLGLHAELWLGNPYTLADRRKLMTLYHDVLGVDQDSPAAVNWLSETTWSGAGEFLAIGGHLFPGDSIRPRGLLHGVITATGADVAIVPGTAGDSIAHFALVENGAAILFVDSTAVIRRVTVPGGLTSVAATLALSPNGRSLDIGCRSDACVVLTRDGVLTHWDLWRLDVASGALTLLRTFTHPLTGAKLSPGSGDVVALEGRNLYFLANLLP